MGSDATTGRPTSGHGTLPAVRTEAESRRHRAVRRVILSVLTLLVLAALTGWLGVRMGTTEGSANGWTIEVVAPEITRSALDAPITITVDQVDGLDGPIDVRIDRTVIDHLDVNLVAPAPAEESGSGTFVTWTFDPPAQGPLTVTIDARLTPTEKPGWQRLSFAVLEQGRVVVEVRPLLVVLP